MKAKTMVAHTKRQVADCLKLPKDLSRGEALLSMSGKSDLFIENYKGILECSKQQIMIATGNCKIQIQGKALHIAYYTDEEMKVEGNIQTISFV